MLPWHQFTGFYLLGVGGGGGGGGGGVGRFLPLQKKNLPVKFTELNCN